MGAKRPRIPHILKILRLVSESAVSLKKEKKMSNEILRLF